MLDFETFPAERTAKRDLLLEGISEYGIEIRRRSGGATQRAAPPAPPI